MAIDYGLLGTKYVPVRTRYRIPRGARYRRRYVTAVGAAGAAAKQQLFHVQSRLQIDETKAPHSQTPTTPHLTLPPHLQSCAVTTSIAATVFDFLPPLRPSFPPFPFRDFFLPVQGELFPPLGSFSPSLLSPPPRAPPGSDPAPPPAYPMSALDRGGGGGDDEQEEEEEEAEEEEDCSSSSSSSSSSSLLVYIARLEWLCSWTDRF